MDLAIVVAVVVVALAFDYTNGFHDAANAIATSVSTRALTPRIALILAAVMNFVGALLGQEVAKTVSDVISPPSGNHGLVIVLAGLLGAITWNLITWYFGLPSSSSHALIGGLVGAALAAGAGVHWATILDKVVIPMVLSPLFGFIAGFGVMLAIMWIFRSRSPAQGAARLPADADRLGRGAGAGPRPAGRAEDDGRDLPGADRRRLLPRRAGGPLPLWVVIAAASAISLGTYSGGWRIMRTLGRRIIHLDPARGFSAESVGAAVLYTTAFVCHAPISTTHTITSAIMGAGATKRFSAVRWGVARSILIAWVSTFPAAGLVAALVYLVLKFVFQLP